MTTDATLGDADTGLTVLFALLAIGGALVMYLGAGEVIAGWGFALAVAAAVLAVAAPHLWE